jgi:hypothetical protein
MSWDVCPQHETYRTVGAHGWRRDVAHATLCRVVDMDGLRRRRRVIRAVAGSTAALVLAAGCGPGGGDDEGSTASRTRSISPVPAPSPSPRTGIELSFVQQRFDEGTPRANVRVGNHTEDLLRVRSVGVDWPGFPGRPQRVDYDVPGGLTVDLRYVLPRPDCSARAGSAPAQAVVVTRRRTIRQPMPRDGMGFLTRIWRTTCNEQRIARAASVRFDDRWSEGEGTGMDGVMRGSLLLERRQGTEPVEVTQLEGSVLFELGLAGAGRLEGDARRVAVPIEVRPGRCDEHGRSQATQTFVFRVWVSVGDGEPLVLNLVPTRRQQARMLAFLDHVCG